MESKGFEVDLTNCDKEPIHIPGKIQPHGFILVVDKSSRKIVQVSRNTEEHIGITPKSLLNQPIEQFLDEDQLAVVKNWEEAQAEQPVNLVQVTFDVSKEEKRYNMIFHYSANSLVLEFEPLEHSIYSSLVNFYHYQNAIIGRYQQCKTLEELCQVTAEEVKKLTGYDRVMLYQFDDDYNGKVISEAKEDFITPFLGHHFPASDIPKQARALYLKNWVRILPDRDYEPVSLLPEINPESDEPLDLSLSTLRSVSPIHLEYLQNMGVQATLVISIIQNDKLWGLISCHHYSPKFIDYHLRASCEFLGKIFSYNLSLLQESQDEEYIRSKREAFYRLKEHIASKDVIGSLAKKNTSGHLSEAVFQALARKDVSMLNLNYSHGAAIAYEGELETMGTVPSENFILEIIGWLKDRFDTNGLYQTIHLSEDFPQAIEHKGSVAGLLAVCINPALEEYLLWFKPEVILTKEWAGNPNKPVLVEEDEEMRLTPRKSFEKWSVEIEGKSQPWKPIDIELALLLRESIRDKKIEQKEELSELNEELEKLVQNRTWELKEALYKQQELNEELSITEEELKVSFDQTLLQHHELQKYTEELDELLQGMPLAVSYVDEEGKIAKINRSFTELFGYGEHDVSGKKISTLFPTFDFKVFKKKFNESEFMKGLQTSLKGFLAMSTKSLEEKLVMVDNRLWENKGGKKYIILYIQDIGEQRFSAQGEKASDLSQLQLALDAAELGICEYNIASEQVYFDKRWALLTETGDKSYKKTLSAWFDMIHPEDRGEVEEKVERLRSGKYVNQARVDFEYRLVKPKGSTIVVNTIASVVKIDESGQPERIIATVQDVSLKKNNQDMIEQLLQQSEMLTKKLTDNEKNLQQSLDHMMEMNEKMVENQSFTDWLLEAVPDIIYVRNIQSEQTLFENRSVFSLLGYDDKSSLPMNYLSLIHPEDRKRVKEGWQKTANLKRGEMLNLEYRIRRSDSSYLWFFERVLVFSQTASGDASSMVIGICQDITRRKSAEENLYRREREFKNLAENSPDIICRVDTDLRYLYINHPIQEYSGKTPQEYMGKTVIDMPVFLGNGQILEQQIRKVMEIEQDCTFDVELQEGDLSHAFHVRLSPEFSNNSTVSSVLCVARDISELKLIQQDLEEHFYQLEQVNEELDKFVYSASHELRSPLSSILGLLNLSNYVQSQKELSDFIDLMRNSIHSLDEIIHEIIDYSKNSRLEVEVDSVDFNSLLSGLIEDLDYIHNQNRVEIIKHMGSVKSFNSDESRIRVVFKNLLSNALSYTLGKGEPVVQINIEQQENGNVKAVFSDNGIGIAKEQSDKIFDMFYRGTEYSKGSGLGLYITKETVKKLGGSIDFTSKQNEGATFTVILPNLEKNQ